MKKTTIITDKTFNVVGSKGDNYIVEIKNNNWSCTCKAFEYSKETPPNCKHIKRVQVLTPEEVN